MRVLFRPTANQGWGIECQVDAVPRYGERVKLLVAPSKRAREFVVSQVCWTPQEQSYAAVVRVRLAAPQSPRPIDRLPPHTEAEWDAYLRNALT